jgi:hypothetical protein
MSQRNASVVRATRMTNEKFWMALPRAVNLGRDGFAEPLMDRFYTVPCAQPGAAGPDLRLETLRRRRACAHSLVPAAARRSASHR